MNPIANIRLILAAALIAFWIVLGAWWHTSRVHAAEQAVHAHYAAVLAGISEKTAAAATAFRARETYWQTRFDKEAQDGQTRIDTARRDADGARAAADGLRATLARYRTAARTTPHPGTAAAGQGELGGEAVDLLAGVLDRHTAELAAVGGFADTLYAHGVTCENSADALTDPRRPDGGTTLSTSP